MPLGRYVRRWNRAAAFVLMNAVEVRHSDLDLGFDCFELVSRHSQVATLPIKRNVKEQTGGIPLHGTDQVVLSAQRNQDILDLVVQPELVHDLHLGADDAQVAGAGDCKVNPPSPQSRG